MAVWTSAAHRWLSYLCGSFGMCIVAKGRGRLRRDKYLLHSRYENTFDPKGGLDRADHRDGLMGHGVRFHDRTRFSHNRRFYFAALDGKELLPRLTYATEDGCVIRIYRFAKRYLK